MGDHHWYEIPIVIDPPNFDIKKAWGWHRDEVAKCGGLTYEDGEPNWQAAFSADPGCCGCPRCDATTWAFGRKQQCARCGFAYPVDAWAMYSYGVQAAQREAKWGLLSEHARRMEHPYYRYGYEHPTEDIWGEFKRTNWAEIFPDDRPTTPPTDTP